MLPPRSKCSEYCVRMLLQRSIFSSQVREKSRMSTCQVGLEQVGTHKRLSSISLRKIRKVESTERVKEPVLVPVVIEQVRLLRVEVRHWCRLRSESIVFCLSVKRLY